MDWKVLQCFKVRLRNCAIKRDEPEFSEVNVIWVFGRLNFLDKIFKTRDLSGGM